MFDTILMELPRLIETYGYGLVALIIALESMGLPLPGEATLITASVYAGATQRLSLSLIILAAVAGAVIGDNAGFWLGDKIGYRLLIRYGQYLRITPGKIKLGQYLFRQHGGKVVFFGRFVAVLRALAAFLAGANRMPWSRFFVFNVAGGFVWAGLFGVGAYTLGHRIHQLAGPVGWTAVVLALAFCVWLFLFVKRNEARLEAEAERAIPGPLVPER
jgi:membrane protein DedA with SNARE-associated domain